MKVLRLHYPDGSMLYSVELYRFDVGGRIVTGDLITVMDAISEHIKHLKFRKSDSRLFFVDENRRWRNIKNEYKPKPKPKKATIIIGDCTLTRTEGGRCERGMLDQCGRYYECLDRTYKAGWGGWRV